MGADGEIGTFYILMPELFVDVYNHCTAGRHAEAMAAQRRINERVELTLRFPMLAAVKRTMIWAGVPCGEPVPLAGALAASSFLEQCSRIADGG